MVVHAPLENYTSVSAEYVYLPQRVGDRVRPEPTYFIDEPAWGATPLLLATNSTDVEQEIVGRVSASDTYTLSTTISGECSAGIEGPITINEWLAKITFEAKLGASRTVSTTSSYEIGREIRTRVPPHTRVTLYAQRAAFVEQGTWDAYGRNGYQGTIYTENLSRNSPGFEYIWKQYPPDEGW
ncbi:MAG: hypothetical protein KatS3mg016_1423 [Fimbriimonadales bacterium]|nr:MAG: hypothetical protein KatS3mg016_1423 [Fimbriimonadales bacterium]